MKKNHLGTTKCYNYNHGSNCSYNNNDDSITDVEDDVGDNENDEDDGVDSPGREDLL